MTKKKQQLPTWLKSALISIIVIPIIAFSWQNIQAIWASPQKLEDVSTKVEKQQSALDQVATLVVEQKSRQDKQEAVSDAQLNALKAQLELVAELKRKK